VDPTLSETDRDARLAEIKAHTTAIQREAIAREATKNLANQRSAAHTFLVSAISTNLRRLYQATTCPFELFEHIKTRFESNPMDNNPTSCFYCGVTNHTFPACPTLKSNYARNTMRPGFDRTVFDKHGSASEKKRKRDYVAPSRLRRKGVESQGVNLSMQIKSTTDVHEAVRWMRKVEVAAGLNRVTDGEKVEL
ncbi:hypothetical protein DYB31_016331, partial [Aphanomyces astaci]